MGSPLLRIGTMVCWVHLVGKPSHMALLKMCASNGSKVSRAYIKCSPTNPSWSWAFPNCSLSMAFLTFCGVKKVDSCGREAFGWGRGGCPGISYRTFAYSCHTWGEVSCVVGCLSLNIFHALLLSCPRNKWYKWSSNLAKYNLFFFGVLLFLVWGYKYPEKIVLLDNSINESHFSFLALIPTGFLDQEGRLCTKPNRYNLKSDQTKLAMMVMTVTVYWPTCTGTSWSTKNVGITHCFQGILWRTTCHRKWTNLVSFFG